MKVYKARCTEEKLSIILSLDSKPAAHINTEGILLIFLSENKYPGKPFIVFYSHHSGQKLKTSPGNLHIDTENKIIDITTQTGNYYKFKLIS